jgi:hypothetical protein
MALGVIKVKTGIFGGSWIWTLFGEMARMVHRDPQMPEMAIMRYFRPSDPGSKVYTLE